MIFKHKLGLTTFALFLLFILLAFSSNPPNGNTGAPGDGVCSSCHGGGGGGFDGNITLSGLPGSIDGGETVQLSFTVTYTSGSPARGGFQAVALRDDTNTNAGDFFNPGSSTNTNTQGSSGREYVEHSPAQMFGGGTEVEYTIEWEAPNVDDDVTIYATALLGNGSGSGGDKTIFAQFNTTVSSVAAPLDIEIVSSNDVSCFDGDDGTATAMEIGGVGPYEFEWENGETGPTAVNLDAGIHDVTVTDDTGATASTSVSIGEPDEIDVDITTTDISCAGEMDGIISLDPSGGTGSLECTFGGGLNGCTQTNLAAGTYFFTVTDANGCQVSGEADINDAAEITVEMSSTNESTAGANDGTATATPSGGSTPYEFDWSNGENTSGLTSTIENLAAGDYEVTVIDANGCEVVASITVMPGECNISADASISNVSCFGGADGSIDITVTNGADPIEFNWSNGVSTEDLNNATAGTYSVTIIDNGNCTVILDNLMIDEPQELVLSVNEVINTECADDATGSIGITITGGTPDYLVEWSDGSTTTTNGSASLDGLLPGDYSFTITDANSCITEGNAEVLNEDDVAPTLILKEGFIYIGENGMTELSDFSLVDDGSSDNCAITDIVFPAAIYDCSEINVYELDVSIADAAGNMTPGIAILNVVDTIPPEIDCSMNADITVSSCDPIDYEIPTATDNCNVAEITLIEGFAPGSIFPSGTTTVTYQATDDCGWSSTCSFTVTVNVDLAINANSTDVTCPGGSDGTLTFDFAGGTAPYSFIIIPAIDDLNNIPAGEYTITATDEANCVAETTVVIEEPDALDAEDVEIINADPGEANGAINITAVGGTEPYSFEWSDSNGNIISTEEDVAGLAIGTYMLVITDSNGCVSEVLSFTVDSTSSTSEVAESIKILIGPNPAFNFININQPKVTFEEFKLFDTQGKIIDIQKLNGELTRYNITSLEQGIYILVFGNGKDQVSKQFIKI